jgi:hypothetical protein
MVFKFVCACAWHLAWHVRVALPVVHVCAHGCTHARLCLLCVRINCIAVTAF